MSHPPPPSSSEPAAAIVDLNALASIGTISVNPVEPAEERTARLSEAAEDARHRRRKDWVTFLVTVTISLAVGLASLILAIWSTGDLQKWGMQIVTLLLGGAIGFWRGKSTSP